MICYPLGCGTNTDASKRAHMQKSCRLTFESLGRIERTSSTNSSLTKRRRACMIDRVADLLRRQADVDRLKHRSHHRDREKGFEKSVAVPVQHSDRVARSNTDLSQRARQPPNAVPKLAVSQSSEIAVDDLLLRRRISGA